MLQRVCESRRFSPRVFVVLALACLLLAGCAPVTRRGADGAPALAAAQNAAARACPVTPPLWRKPPEDAAVLNEPQAGPYYVNADRSIWAAAPRQAEAAWRAGEEGVKVGWFRPAGAVLAISGQRTDGAAPLLDSHVPCCYPTRFQATGLIFPAPGCWQITAQAAGSELSFTVWVAP
jgi:hypothetical protein